MFRVIESQFAGLISARYKRLDDFRKSTNFIRRISR
jgi:hypothetical protein